jgi:hypothetical protein
MQVDEEAPNYARRQRPIGQPSDRDLVKTIDNSTMIVGPVGDAYYFSINYFSINAALSAI